MGLGGSIGRLVEQGAGKAPSGGVPESEDARERLAKSGAGLAIACATLLVFVLAASFLKSIVFGLILAYFLLPLENCFESLLLKFKKRPADSLDGAEAASLASRATLLTLGSLALTAALLLSLAAFFALPAIGGARASIRDWAASNQTIRDLETRAKAELGLPSSQAGVKQESLVPLFSNWAAAQFGAWLGGEGAKGSAATFALDNGHEILAGALSIAKAFFESVFDALLAGFFLLYFLQKMAAFKRVREPGRGSTGAWLVKGIFDTRWMPLTSEESRAEAASSIDKICQMLRAWVRGYISIILIESAVYILAFLLLDVPYAPLLGFVAGCTILVPFIGPLVSGVLTLGVCLAAGDCGVLALAGVVVCYLLVHGILEQLILYPRLVGESIGLTSLETIIVVLLGGLFAGVAGMIFAVPAASVLKYLIPAAYRCCLPPGATPTPNTRQGV